MKKIIGVFISIFLIGTALQSYGMNYEFNENNVINMNNKNFEFVPGEFIVKFKESPISCVPIDILNDKYNVISMEKMFTNVDNTPLDNMYILKLSKIADIISIVNEYSSLPNVEYAEPNYIIKYILNPIKPYKGDLDIGGLNYNIIPDDPYFIDQWLFQNNGQYDGTPGADIDALQAWDIEKGGSEVIIAIIDAGVDYNHPDLIDNIWVNEGEIPDNDIDDDNNGYIDDYYGYDTPTRDDDDTVLDLVGHGTFCAGIASAVTNNGLGIAGVCWNCKIMIIQPFNIYHSMLTNEFVESLKYAVDNGADILSMSFASRDIHTTKRGYEYAYDKGAVLIACAGNYNTSDKRENYPAAYDFVMAIAATNQLDERCDEEDWNLPGRGSNYGEWVDVAAPGNNFIGLMPTYEVFYNYQYGIDKNYAFINGGGTSWSTPVVAGIAALLLSQDPTLSYDEIRRIIRANVDPYISEEYIGTGRVNAYKALTRFNTQPKTPDTPSGKTNGKPGREYSFTTSATDEDGDELLYFWDWGNGKYSEWLGPYESGEECEASYTWQQEANFSIKVKVKDGKGGESYWSEEFIFSTPKNKILDNILLERLASRFPILEFLI
jgi:subtilisin family serine protease